MLPLSLWLLAVNKVSCAMIGYCNKKATAEALAHKKLISYFQIKCPIWGIVFLAVAFVAPKWFSLTAIIYSRMRCLNSNLKGMASLVAFVNNIYTLAVYLFQHMSHVVGYFTYGFQI